MRISTLYSPARLRTSPHLHSPNIAIRWWAAWMMGLFLLVGGDTYSEDSKKGEAPPNEPEAVAKPRPDTAADDEKPKRAEGENSPKAASDEPKPGHESESAPEEKPKLTAEEARILMLKRIADNLSKRMRTLSERERLMADREKAIADREAALMERESLLEARENVVRRREQLPPPQAWKGPDPPKVVGKYVAVIDGRTMQFYYQKDAKTKTPVASTQKLMTALVVCSESDLDEEIEVPEAVLRVEPTVIGVKPGQTYTRRELLRALLVRSGNDIAATLAIDNAGSVEAFAEKMNTFARSLGMENTNFLNPHGLPAEGQYSCAHDIALLAFEAYQNADIREMIKIKKTTFTFTDGSTRDLYNTNQVLSSSEYCNGMKTGFTYASGHCLVCSGEKDGQDRIIVTIKSSKPYVWTDSKKLLDWALDLEVSPRSETGTETEEVAGPVLWNFPLLGLTPRDSAWINPKWINPKL